MWLELPPPAPLLPLPLKIDSLSEGSWGKEDEVRREEEERWFAKLFSSSYYILPASCCLYPLRLAALVAEEEQKPTP